MDYNSRYLIIFGFILDVRVQKNSTIWYKEHVMKRCLIFGMNFEMPFFLIK